MWKCHRLTDKSYPGDNRLISPKSSHRRGGLAPRCRLITERRETVRSLSVVGVGYLRGADLSTRGPGRTHLRCTSCTAKCIAG